MLFLTALLAIHLGPVSPQLPNKQPQLAAGKNAVVMVFGSGNAIWFARSTDQGKTFSKPSQVAELPRLALGRHRGPRVVVSGDAILVSAILSQSDLHVWRSTDAGRTWSKPAILNDQPKATEEGLHAMAADSEGHVATVWLDARTPKSMRLYGSFSNDGGVTWSKNVPLYQSPERTICECCHPSLVSLGHGEFAAMWRNVIDGSRDFYALLIKDGKPAGAAVKQGTGTWKLEACPMDGGGVALLNGQLVSAWRREHDVYFAEPGKETKIAAGQDVALAVGSKGPYLIWSTPKGVDARLPGAPDILHVSDAGAFPVLLALPGGSVLAAWEQNGSIATHRFD